MSDKELIRKWDNRIQKSKGVRNDEKGTWDRILKIYNMDYKRSNGKELRVNMFFVTQENKLASFYYRNPKMSLHPETPIEAIPLKSFTSKMNHWIRSANGTGIKPIITRCLKDSLTYPIGIAKLVWEKETVKVEGMGGEAVDVEKEVLNIYRVSPEKILFDTSVESFMDVNWVVEEIEMPLKDVKANPDYKNTADLKPTSEIGNIEYQYSVNTIGVKDPEEQSVWLYEIHDYKNDKIIVYAEGHDKILYEQDNVSLALGVKKHYFPLAFNTTPNRLYPLCDLELWRNQQEERDLNRTFRSAAAAKANRKILVAPSVNKKAQEDLISSNDCEVVVVNNPQNDVAPLIETNVSTDIDKLDNLIDNDIAVLSGVSDTWRGNITKGTATEVDIADKRSKTRLDYQQNIVDVWLIDILYHATLMTQKLMSAKEEFMETEQGANQMINFNPQDIRDLRFKVQLEVTSALPHNDLLARKQWTDLLPFLANNPLIDQRKLFYKLFEVFGEEDASDMIIAPMPTQNPMEIMGGQTPPQAGGQPTGPEYQEITVPTEGKMTGEAIRNVKI